MSERNDSIRTRRDVLRGAGRAVAAVALAAIAGLAIFSRRGDGDEHRCIALGLCRGCGKFRRCALPAALSAKQARKKA